MTDYNKLKVTELKELLKERGIPSTGLSRKIQIVEALEAHDAENGDGDHKNGGEDEIAADDVDATLQYTGEESMQEERTIAEDQKPLEKPPPVEDVPGHDDAMLQQPSEPIAEPSVTGLEKNEPVSKEPSVINTPQRMSPGAESISSDTRKRKRRSPTIPLRQASVSKKLKSAEEDLVKLPEDRVVEDAPVPMVDAHESSTGDAEAKTIQPLGVSDDVMDVTSSLPAEDVQARSGSPMDTGARNTQPDYLESESEETTGPPSVHPPTRAIYIRDLVRPLQPQQLQDHLISIATSPPSDSAIKTFHLDTLRTHAFVVFDTLKAASTTRATLHGRIWPDEPSRKELWVDFVPEAKVHDWIEEEVAIGSRRDAKKWEIRYDTDSDGRAIPSHQEVASQPPAPGLQRQRSPSGPSAGPTQGQGMPNAPLGPRADRPSTSTPSHQPPQPSVERSPPPPKPQNTTFTLLDQNFHHTASKPKLYWHPVSPTLAERRLDALDAQTSRSWAEGRAMREAPSVEGPLRRYTFEDGERVVDNGADIPSFRSEGGRPPGIGRGGRGGGGGFRGRGW